MNSLLFKSVRELSGLLVSRELSARELLDASLAQIDRVNPSLNAIITFDRDGAYANADVVDARRAAGKPTSPLAGLPIAIKDLEAVKGMRTTSGSPIFKDWIPDYDTLMVERFRAHGLTLLGKTNVPEFALGSQTFNTLFGATKNPWDTTKTCGGSSGGAAVAVATGMLPFADGSDMAAVCATRLTFAAWSDCALRRAECRAIQPSITGARSACWGRLRARRRTLHGCSPFRPVTIRA